MKLRFLLFVVVCAVLAWTPAALASGAASQGYGGGGGNVQNEVNQGVAAANGVASSGTLPFTGLDLALLVAGGMALLVLGVSLRRAAARRNS